MKVVKTMDFGQSVCDREIECFDCEYKVATSGTGFFVAGKTFGSEKSEDDYGKAKKETDICI